jgi:hypothetical protein
MTFVADVIFFVGMRCQRAAWVAGISLLACSPEGKSPTPATVAAPVRLRNVPAQLAISLDSGATVQYGRVAGDSGARLVIRPMMDSASDYRLCGVVAGASRIPPALLARWPVDTNAPVLAWRALSTPHVQGVRFLMPGQAAYYYFEGVTREGSRRVSLRWPVTADPGNPVPVGAPDSLMESLLSPHPRQVDSVVAALTVDDNVVAQFPSQSANRPVQREHAVLLLRDLPLYEVTLSPACPTATVAVPVLARTDVMVRVPTTPGDVVRAQAEVTDGTVRIGFDEAPPREELRERASIPEAVIEAGAMPRVTLRVRVQVVPRAQSSQQVVYLTLQKTRPAQ